jgi:hypothetical protein
VFEERIEERYVHRRDFLADFEARGFYLVDLFKERGKTVGSASEEELESSIDGLSSFIQQSQPRLIVTVLKRIDKHVREAVNRSNVKPRYESTVFPTYDGVRRYRSQLRHILHEIGNIS